MSRIYKLSIKNYYDGGTVKLLAVKPISDTFASFKEENFSRFSALNRRKLELYYEDADADKISIILSNDFEIFKQRKIDRAVESVQVKVEGELLQIPERAEKRKLDIEIGDGAELLGAPRNEISTTTTTPAKRPKRPRFKGKNWT